MASAQSFRKSTPPGRGSPKVSKNKRGSRNAVRGDKRVGYGIRARGGRVRV